MREGLAPLIASIKAKGAVVDDSWLQGDYDVDKQAALCKQVCDRMRICTLKRRCKFNAPHGMGRTYRLDCRHARCVH